MSNSVVDGDDERMAKRACSGNHEVSVERIAMFRSASPDFNAYERIWTAAPSLDLLMTPGALFAQAAYVRPEYIELYNHMMQANKRFKLFQLHGTQGIGKVSGQMCRCRAAPSF